MPFLASKRTTEQYKVTLKDETGTAIPKANVSSFKLTLFNLDDDAKTIINARTAQEQVPFTGDIAMDTTSGLVTFTMTPNDNPILTTLRYERHGIVYDVTLANGKRVVWEDEIRVEDKDKVS